MALVQIQAHLAHTSGLPADTCINTFNFDAALAAEPALHQLVQDFYLVAGTEGGAALSTYLSQDLSRGVNACKTVCFEPDQVTAVQGPAISSVPFTLGTTVHTTRLPEEVAICLSFKAGAVSEARKRGRIFFGPLNQSALFGNISSPAPDLMTDLTRRAIELRDAVEVEDELWVVWSRADGALWPITDGWVDNAFDTMRSRGERATARTLWT